MSSLVSRLGTFKPRSRLNFLLKVSVLKILAKTPALVCVGFWCDFSFVITFDARYQSDRTVYFVDN